MYITPGLATTIGLLSRILGLLTAPHGHIGNRPGKELLTATYGTILRFMLDAVRPQVLIFLLALKVLPVLTCPLQAWLGLPILRVPPVLRVLLVL